MELKVKLSLAGTKVACKNQIQTGERVSYVASNTKQKNAASSIEM